MRRLDQLLANLGYCSRRQAREWIEAGRAWFSSTTITFAEVGPVCLASLPFT